MHDTLLYVVASCSSCSAALLRDFWRVKRWAEKSNTSSDLHWRLFNSFQSMVYGPSTVYDLSLWLLQGSKYISHAWSLLFVIPVGLMLIFCRRTSVLQSWSYCRYQPIYRQLFVLYFFNVQCIKVLRKSSRLDYVLYRGQILVQRIVSWGDMLIWP